VYLAAFRRNKRQALGARTERGAQIADSALAGCYI
jgi:hypothetical protein